MAQINMIAGIGRNRELGKKNQLLWHIPEDLAYFKKTTEGHPVIMGRATYESLPDFARPLPGRTNIVLARTEERYAPDGVIVAHSLDEAFEIAAKESAEPFVIGGASIYMQALERTDRLYLTLIDAEDPEADVFFPEYEDLFTKEIAREDHDNGTHKFSFVVLEK